MPLELNIFSPALTTDQTIVEISWLSCSFANQWSISADSTGEREVGWHGVGCDRRVMIPFLMHFSQKVLLCFTCFYLYKQQPWRWHGGGREEGISHPWNRHKYAGSGHFLFLSRLSAAPWAEVLHSVLADDMHEKSFTCWFCRSNLC